MRKSRKFGFGLAAMIFSSSAAFAQTGTVDIHVTESALAVGDQTYAGGHGWMKVDPFTVRAPGSWMKGSLEGNHGGFAEGEKVSMYDGVGYGHIDLTAKPGFVSGNALYGDHAVSHTTPGGLAQTYVGGHTALNGFVRLPIDPLVTANAEHRAFSGNWGGLPSTSSGLNWATISIGATGHH